VSHLAELLRRPRRRVDWLRFGRSLDVVPRDDLVQLGSEYGGYVVPLGVLDSDSTVYSCGVGEDVTFDLALIAEIGCGVHAFDPTPRAAKFAIGVSAREPRFHFLPYRVWNADETMRFFAPEDESHVSHSIGNLQHTQEYFDAECRSIHSIMAELGHTKIDLLKLDVEGAEYEILRSVVEHDIPVRVVCAEFHEVTSIADAITFARLFVEAGFTPVHAKRLEATFVATTWGAD